MAYAPIASVSAASSDGIGVTTGAIDTTGADLLALFVAGNSGSSPAVSDSKGNTWNGLTFQEVAGGERGRWYWCRPTSVGAGHTFSAGSGSLPAIFVLAFSGSAVAPFDQENSGTTFGSTLQPGSLTPSEDNCLIVQGITFNVAGTLSLDGGYSAPIERDLGANNKGGAVAYKVQAAAAATNPTWTHNPGGSSMAAIAAIFKSSGADTTPPTASGWATNTAGTSITVTLSESGCVADGGGTSGTGGFTLAGTSATVSGWSISGTTLTLTLSGTVANGQVVTASYARAGTTDDIKDAAGNYLADISGAAVTNNVPSALTAGAASFVSSGPGGISVSATAPGGGSGAGPTYQWERNADGGAYANLAGAATLAITDATAVPGVLYLYRCKQTRGADTVTTGAVPVAGAEVYDGGPLGGGSSGPTFGAF